MIAGRHHIALHVGIFDLPNKKPQLGFYVWLGDQAKEARAWYRRFLHCMDIDSIGMKGYL